MEILDRIIKILESIKLDVKKILPLKVKINI